MARRIHESASVNRRAALDDDVEIGPFCVVGAEVSLGKSVRLISHVVVSGRATIGEGSVVHPFTCLGGTPQDLKYEGEASSLIIGKNARIREHVTVHRGTRGGGFETRIGDNCLLMTTTHIAHDCRIGDNVVMATDSGLAGHVHIGDHVIVGGAVGVHQFVHIGAYAMVGAGTMIRYDVIPYGLARLGAPPAILAGVNLVGLRRHGFTRGEIGNLQAAYDLLFKEEGAGSMADRAALVARRFASCPRTLSLARFVEESHASPRRGLSSPLTPPFA